MVRARSSARAANAPALAGGSYRAASDAEREAQRMFQAGRLAEATAKFYEASGLFRSAEIAAESNAAAEAERKRQAQIAAERERELERERRAQPAEPAPASPPVSTGTPLPALPPASSPGTFPPPPAPPAPSAPAQAPAPQAEPPRTPPAEEAIRDVLDRYKSALEARSLEALKRLWPTLSGAQQAAIQNEFSHASRIDVDILDPRIAVSGSSATVAFIRRYELVTVDGQRLNNDTRATMTLQRANGGWVIEAIRFDAPRRG
jgi:hypothetical protein